MDSLEQLGVISKPQRVVYVSVNQVEAQPQRHATMQEDPLRTYSCTMRGRKVEFQGLLCVLVQPIERVRP